MAKAHDPAWMLRDLDRAKTDRNPWDRRWEPQRKYFGPDDARFNGKKMPAGQRDRRVTIDTYGVIAARRLQRFLYNSIITPGASFDMALADVETDKLLPETRKWLADERDGIYADMLDLESGFQVALGGVCSDMKYGNAWMVSLERPGRVPLSRHVPLAQAWAVEDKDGQICRFYWPQEIRAEDAWEDWGDDAGETVKRLCESEEGAATKVEFVWFCEKNPEYNPYTESLRAKRWRCGWIAVKDKKLVEEGFSRTPAFQEFRMLRTGGEMYAVGPADDCLEEIRMAQRSRGSTIASTEKHTNPTYIIPDDGVVSMTTHEARGEIVVRADLMMNQRDPVRQLQPTGDPRYGLEFTKEIHAIIDEHFFRRLIELPREPRMTVDQVLGIQEEAARGTAPLVLPLLVGMAGVVMRYHDLRRRDGRVREAPEEARKHKLNVKFTSPLAKAALLAGVNAFIKALQFTREAMLIDQRVVVVVNWVKGLRKTLLSLGVDADLIPGGEELDAMVQQMGANAERKDQLEEAKDKAVAARQITPAVEFLSKLFGGNDNAAAQAA